MINALSKETESIWNDDAEFEPTLCMSGIGDHSRMRPTELQGVFKAIDFSPVVYHPLLRSLHPNLPVSLRVHVMSVFAAKDMPSA